VGKNLIFPFWGLFVVKTQHDVIFEPLVNLDIPIGSIGGEIPTHLTRYKLSNSHGVEVFRLAIYFVLRPIPKTADYKVRFSGRKSRQNFVLQLFYGTPEIEGDHP